MPKDSNVAIIGVGLIGGSLGMALRRAGGYRVTGIGRDERKLRLAQRRGAVDRFTTGLAEGLKDADIAVLCTPVDVIAATVRKTLPHLKDGAVITDAGSIKGAVHRRVQPLIKRTGRQIFFVGGHPMAGSEKAGVEFADARLYNNACVAVCAEPGTPDRARVTVEKMWRKTGARVINTAPGDHDRMVAFASHLPHILAFGLCRVVSSAAGRDPRTAKLLATSFRDMTRIADSSPRDWAAICSGNSKELVRAIDRCIIELKALRNRTGSLRRLEKAFSEAKSARQNLLYT